ncbi:hypothetical protein [Pseudorhodoferax sp. Leaf267]|uniref:hypothetical protein n=1 Tax=Pseudorhodoferax sp. Leaf267 TaxID=1736316 RepID=UPI0006FFA1F1|nr:hypothetical protein [Pseudorhodoferax sp. Leaf267]KQP22409.1 hypothetical protein ASF43_00295 [Pseudorhodoferax sp. Leaf267]
MSAAADRPEPTRTDAEGSAPSVQAGRLRLLAPGATDAQRERGEAAAAALLLRSGITAEQAKRGADARVLWGESGLAPLSEPTSADVAAANAWDNATEVALMACYRGATVPLEAELEWVATRG